MHHLGVAQMQVSFPEIWKDVHTSCNIDYLRQYLVQVRQELAARLVEKLYADGTGKPSKWWMSFQKRRFMNRSLGT
jgi:ARP2/3 complex ARPC3 (21 kDa) subunit